MRFLITNGGPHPSDKWADATTEAILDLIRIEQDSVSPEAAAARQAKRDLQPVLFGLFNAHHDAVQKHEQGHMAKAVKDARAADDHVGKLLDPAPHMNVLGAVKDALAKTLFAAHFAKPEAQEAIRQIIGQHTADVMYIERRWHQDRLKAKGV